MAREIPRGCLAAYYPETNILIDLGAILVLREMPVGPHEKFVALISLALIPWHASQRARLSQVKCLVAS